MNTHLPLNPRVALAVAAHPDDLEYFGIAGTAALWAMNGTRVYYLIITDGSKGTTDRHTSPEDLVKIRCHEQLNAAKTLGVCKVIFLQYPDGELVNNKHLKKDLVRVIRKLKPEVVLTMDPAFIYSIETGFINHADHRIAGQATLDAVYPLARDHLSFPELIYKEKLNPHKVQTVLLSNFEIGPYAIDITKTIDKRLDALSAHISQYPYMAKTKKLLRNWARVNGKKVGTNYAESFLRLDLPK
jgi:LmbE family N-acetylglucosaminyl deacetylase